MDTLTTTLAASLPWSHVGYELAVKQINESGGINGRPIVIVPKDTGNDPAITVERMTELKDEGVVAIVGPSSDSLAPAAAQWAMENKMVVITQGTSSTKVSAENANPYFFSSGFNAWQIGKLLAMHCVGEKGFESMVFVVPRSGFNDVILLLGRSTQINNFKTWVIRVSPPAPSSPSFRPYGANPDMVLGGIADLCYLLCTAG